MCAFYLSGLSEVSLKQNLHGSPTTSCPLLPDMRLTLAMPIYWQHSPTCHSGSLLCSKTLSSPSYPRMFVHADPSTCNVFHSHLSMSKFKLTQPCIKSISHRTSFNGIGSWSSFAAFFKSRRTWVILPLWHLPWYLSICLVGTQVL